jgi:hypothetical protein
MLCRAHVQQHLCLDLRRAPHRDAHLRLHSEHRARHDAVQRLPHGRHVHATLREVRPERAQAPLRAAPTVAASLVACLALVDAHVRHVHPLCLQRFPAAVKRQRRKARRPSGYTYTRSGRKLVTAT